MVVVALARSLSVFDTWLPRINYGCFFAEVRAAIFDAAGSHSGADPASRSRCVREVLKFLQNRHALPGCRLDECDCAVSVDAGVEGGKIQNGKDILRQKFHPSFLS